jgi:hypothetical protein
MKKIGCKNKFEQHVNFDYCHNGKTWGQLKNAPKEYDLAKLDSDGTKMKHHVAQFERMQNQIKFKISYVNNRDQEV